MKSRKCASGGYIGKQTPPSVTPGKQWDTRPPEPTAYVNKGFKSRRPKGGFSVPASERAEEMRERR